MLLFLGLGYGKAGHKLSCRYWAAQASLQFECCILDRLLYLRSSGGKYITEIISRSILSLVQIAARMTINEAHRGSPSLSVPRSHSLDALNSSQLSYKREGNALNVTCSARSGLGLGRAH